MTTAKQERAFENIHSYDDLYRKSLKGKELEPLEILLHQLLGGLITGAEKIPPVGSRGSDWIEEGGADYGLTYSERTTMYKQADRLLRNEPLMINAHRLFLIHICGQGPKVSLIKIDEKVHPLAERLKDLLPNFPSLAQFIISYTLKFGESFALHLPVENNGLGRPKYELFAPNRCRKIHVETPKALRSKIKAYNFPILKRDKNINLEDGMVPPDAMTMFRVHEDLNDGLHGLSLYYVAMKELTRYTDWLHSRGLRARADSIFIILRAVKGVAPGEKHEVPDGPLIIDTHMDQEDWKPIQAAGGARDASVDGYEFRVRAIQATGLPEPDVSGSAQYAAQVRQGTSTSLYEYYQQAFDESLKRFVAITLGLPDTSEIILSWPFVDPRERTQRVAEGSTLARERLISRASVHRRLGYDHELIEQELAEELKLEMEAQPVRPPEQLPLGLGAPVLAPTAVPAPTPEISIPGTPAPGAPEEPEIETALPSGMLSAATGIRRDEISNATDMPSQIAIGVDHGYAQNGAIVLGGPIDGGFAAIGEIRLHRAPIRGEKSWESALRELKKTFPEIKMAYAGSDAPELIDLLKELGFIVTDMKQNENEAWTAIQAYHEAGNSFQINQRCERLVSELFPEEGDKEAGGHIRATTDFWEAFRYLFTGFLGGENAD